MATPIKKAPLAQIGGADLRRFVTHSVLLNLIDLVRGEPTRTPLDENPDGDISSGRQLKLKFIESFALICSTSSKGAETASGVCLEQHDPAGAVLRLARNRGLTTADLAGLEGVLQVLREVARKGTSSAQAETEILRRVVELDRGRIMSIAEKIEKRGIQTFIREARSKLLAGQVGPETRASPGLRPFLESCPFTAAPLQTWSLETMTKLIDWARQARWVYAEQLQRLLGHDRMQRPAWLESVHKVARYYSAIKSMVKLAVKQPEVFSGIQIRELKAPTSRSFSINNQKAPLRGVVEDLVKDDPRTIMGQLEKHLDTQDVEKKLRKACQMTLTLHAEMQLVVFYEGNPSLTPRLPFIGSSKKACFLCHGYLLQHPLRLQVSACHQKIYATWMPPPYYRIPGQFKSAPFVGLSKKIEKLTRQELKTGLTGTRRPKNDDSTAGPSLTLTATVPTGPRSLRAANEHFTVNGGSLAGAWD